MAVEIYQATPSLGTPPPDRRIPEGMGIEQSLKLDAFQERHFDEIKAQGRLLYDQAREVAPGVVQPELL